MLSSLVVIPFNSVISTWLVTGYLETVLLFFLDWLYPPPMGAGRSYAAKLRMGPSVQSGTGKDQDITNTVHSKENSSEKPIIHRRFGCPVAASPLLTPAVKLNSFQVCHVLPTMMSPNIGVKDHNNLMPALGCFARLRPCSTGSMASYTLRLAIGALRPPGGPAPHPQRSQVRSALPDRGTTAQVHDTV